MTDQITAEADNAQDAAAFQQPHDYRARYRSTWRWRVGWAWARYLLAGRGWGVPELIDFVFNNYFFVPLQRPGELRALGEILAELQPQRALEIGTGQGGTLLFLTSLAARRATSPASISRKANPAAITRSASGSTSASRAASSTCT